MKGIFLNKRLIKDYYTLTKPRMVFANLITAIAGFILASQGRADLLLMVFMLLGLAFVISGGCVLNNYIDKDIDGLMERTKERSLVKGLLPLKGIVVYGVILSLIGFMLLYFYTNTATVMAAFVGSFVYAAIYSLWLKRTSVHSTLIGGISGAMPPLIGYLSIKGQLDFTGALLFTILLLWQLPHFFAIAIYRFDDYKNANVPVLPVVKGVARTKIEIFVYTILFVIVSMLLYMYGYTGEVYGIVMLFLGMLWISLSVFGFYVRAKNEKRWARVMFIFSIFVLMTFCVLLGLGGVRFS